MRNFASLVAAIDTRVIRIVKLSEDLESCIESLKICPFKKQEFGSTISCAQKIVIFLVNLKFRLMKLH